jgi:Lrp/AsnC family transcriptional regulator for asnA, asnC and gidA
MGRRTRGRDEESFTLDKIDRQIIAALQVEGRRSFTALADDLGVSVTGVRNRVQRLESSGILQVVGIADPLKIGFDMLALIGVKVAPKALDAVIEAFKALPETSYVVTTAGSFDVFIEVICRDTIHFRDMLNGRIHQVDGVLSTETFFIMEVHKLAYGWGVGEQAVAWVD